MAENIIATVGFQVDTSDLAKLNKQLDDIQKNAQQAGTQVSEIGKNGAAGSGGSSFGSKFTVGLGAVAAAATAATGAVGAFVLNSINNIDELNDAAIRAGLSIERFSELKFAAELSGTNIDTVSKGLLKLGKDAADGGKKLAQLGINIRDANGEIKSSDALLLEVADKFAGYADGTQEAALAAELFGRQAGPELQDLLNKGSEGINKLAEEARNLGVVISEETAEAAGQFNDNLDRLKATGSGAGQILAAELLPIMNQLTGDVNGTTSAFGEFATSLAKVVGFAVKIIVNLGQVIAGLAKGVGLTVAVIVDNFSKGFDTIKDLIDLFKQQISTIGASASLLADGKFAAAGAEILKLGANAEATYNRVQQRARDFADNVTQSYSDLFSDTVDNIVGVWNPVETQLKDTGKAAKDALPQPPQIRASAAATRELTDETKRFASELERIRGLSDEISGLGRRLSVDITKALISSGRETGSAIFGNMAVSASDAFQDIRSSFGAFLDDFDSQIANLRYTFSEFVKVISNGPEKELANSLDSAIKGALSSTSTEEERRAAFERLKTYSQELAQLSKDLQRAYAADLESGGKVNLDLERRIALITELSARTGNIVELNRQLNDINSGVEAEQAKKIADMAREAEYSRIMLELDRSITQENTIQQQIKDGLITSQDELTRILEVEAELQSLINELQQKGITLTEEQTKAIEERIRKRREEADETNEELRKREDFDKFLEDTIGSVGDLLADSIIKGLETGKFSFKQFLYDLGKMLLSSSIKQIFASLFDVDVNTGKGGGGWLSVIGQVISGFFTKGAAKNGGIFDADGAKFFANGGIVNKRTQFGYSGGIGIMGEAGPEAIIPLAKTTDGKLGVRAMGGGVSNVQNFKMAENITIQVQSTDNAQRDDAETAKALDRMLNIKFKQFIQEQQRSGNMLSPKLAQ